MLARWRRGPGCDVKVLLWPEYLDFEMRFRLTGLFVRSSRRLPGSGMGEARLPCCAGAPAYRVVFEALGGDLLKVVLVTSVEDDVLLHGLAHEGKVGIAKWLPIGHQDHGIDSGQGVVLMFGE